MICSTEQFLVPDGELVPGQKLPATHRAAETLDVIHTAPSSHDQITAAEAQSAFCAFYTEQSVECRIENNLICGVTKPRKSKHAF